MKKINPNFSKNTQINKLSFKTSLKHVIIKQLINKNGQFYSI